MNVNKITYKSLKLFHLAAISLLLCGMYLATNNTLPSIFILLWCCICGVFAVYRLNDFIDSEVNLTNKLIHFFNNKLNLVFTLHFILIAIPLSYYYLPFFTFLVLGASGLLGALYSVKFHFKEKVFRIKNTFLLKNISIGISWGALILIGAGNFTDPIVQSLVLFATIQVFIGSIIRDIPDMEKDFQNKVKSVPLVIGSGSTFYLLIGVNFLSVLAIFPSMGNINLWITISAVIIWRMWTLINLKRNVSTVFWSQTANLLTCSLLFIVFYLSSLFYEI